MSNAGGGIFREMVLLGGLVVIACAACAVVRRVDVRLALLLAALALGVLGGQPQAILHRFFATLTAAEYVLPIGCAMGFAFVLRHTGCDRHLVQLLTRPLRRATFFLVPGAVLVGFVVNIPIISQTSAAVAIGSVLIPLLLAARVSRVTAGAALLLGASLGGELLNQGAPEWRTVIRESTILGGPPLGGSDLVRAVLPLDLLHLVVAAGVFWYLSLRADALSPAPPEEGPSPAAGDPAFRISPFKAMVPVLPLFLLFLMAPPLEWVRLPVGWLVGEAEVPSALQRASEFLEEVRYRRAVQEAFDSRLIGAAMLFGAAVAAVTDRKALAGSAGAFFEGFGYAITHIVSIIVVASCFGEGVKLIGLSRPIGALIETWPHLLLPLSGLLPLLFGAVSGSGMASTQSLFPFIAPAAAEHADLGLVGAVVALGAAAGRTMSPVAAVALMCASLTGTQPLDLVRRVALPLLAGMTAVVLAAMLMAGAAR